MFSNAYKPVISGVVRSIMLYKNGLQQAGHFVGLFAPDGRNYEDDEPFIFRYPAFPLPMSMDYSFPLVVAPHITWLMSAIRPEIIHAHHPVILGSEAMNFSRTLGVPLVFTFHTMYHEYTHYFGFEASFFKQLTRRFVGEFASKADRIIAPSVQVRDILPSYNIDRPIDILPTPIDLSFFPARTRPPFADEKRIQLVYVGRVAKEKNIDFLLRSYARAASQEPRLHLRIVGDGPELDKLEAYADKLGLAGRVQFAGAVPYERVPRELLRADCFVFASTTETQGLVVLEAMAAGLPLVLIESPALLEVARPDQDCLVASEDEQTFAQAILALAADHERARALGRSGRAEAEKYNVPVMTQRLLDIYQGTIEAYRKGQRYEG